MSLQGARFKLWPATDPVE